MRFVTRTITIAECKPRGIHYARIYRVFPRGVATRGKEREKERERRWRIGYLFPDLSLFRQNYIAVARHAN